MCSPNTTKTSSTSDSNTSFNQQSLTDFLNKMSQQSTTAQQGTSTSTTGPSEQARKLIEQATKPVSADQINQYMSPYQQKVIDATVAQLNNQYGQQSSQLKGNAISSGALGGDRARVAQAVLAGQQGLNTASTIGTLENQNYAQALAAAQAEQNRALTAAGMSGTTTTGANQQTGTADTTGTSSGTSTANTSGTSQSHETSSGRTAQNLGGVGYATAILGALADGGRVGMADGGAAHFDNGGGLIPMNWMGPPPAMGWSGPSAPAHSVAPAAPAQPSGTEMQGLGKKARSAVQDIMKGMKDPTGKRADAVTNATATPGSGKGGDAGGGSGGGGGGSGGGGGGGLMSRLGQWGQTFGGGTDSASGFGDSLSQGFQGMGDSLSQGAQGAGDAISSGAQGVGDAMAGAGEAIGTGATSIGEGISAGISALAAILAKDGGAIRHRAEGGRADGGEDYTPPPMWGQGTMESPLIGAPGTVIGDLFGAKRPVEDPRARSIQQWMDANPEPRGGLSSMAKSAPVVAPVENPDEKAARARAIQDRINASPAPALDPFRTTVEPTPNLTPVARPGYMAAEEVKPVTTFRVGLDGRPIAEGPGPEPDAAAIAPDLKNDNPESAGMVSERGQERSRGYEDFRSKPYWDHGHWSIGYGSTAQEGEGAITEEEARARHDKDMENSAAIVKKHIHTKLNQDQFDGLALFTNNAGEDSLKKIAGDINKGEFNTAADRMLTFNKSTNDKGEKVPLAGLTARRADEAALVRNTGGERTNQGLVAPEQPAAPKVAAAPAQATGIQGLLQRAGIIRPNTPTAAEFKPAYPGQEPEKGGIINRLTGMNFNPLNLSDRERIAMITGGLGGWQAGANAYTGMRGQDISAAQHGQQLAMEAMKMQQSMAAPTVMNQKIGPYGEKFEEYGHYDQKTGAYVPNAGAASGTSSPYGGMTGDAYNQAIAAVNSGKTGPEFLKGLSPMQAGQADRMGTYQEPPADEKTPQGRMQLAMAARAHPGYDPSQYPIMQKTRQDMLSGATAKVMKSGTTGVQHLAEFFEEADKSGTSSIPAFNKAGNYIAETRGKPGGNPARALAGLGAEETTAFYRGTGGAEGDIERHLSTLNENMAPEQRKAMAGVIAKALEGKINSLDLSRDEAFKGAKTKAPPIMTPEAQEDLNAMKLYARDPNITMAEARKIVKEQAGQGQMIQIGKASVPPAAVQHLLQHPDTADAFDAHYKEPGAAAAAIKLYGGKQ
jgi:GH24 family phage-related lysozyme (muramidase)